MRNSERAQGKAATHRRCLRCKKAKPLEEFSNNHIGYCKECVALNWSTREKKIPKSNYKLYRMYWTYYNKHGVGESRPTKHTFKGRTKKKQKLRCSYSAQMPGLILLQFI
jgi:late competence protein required for DNA uptake (superfamily II DNA/RNA helicase)